MGQSEILFYSEPLPYDISSLTMYGLNDEIQYEVRNHESKLRFNSVEIKVSATQFLNQLFSYTV